MDGRHSLFKLFCQIASTQMNIDERRLRIAMSSKGCNFMDIPVCPCKIGKTKMAKSVGRKLLNSGTVCNALDHLGPGPNRDRTSIVTAGLGEEQGTPFTADLTPMFQVGHVEDPGRLRVGNGSCSPAFRVFSADM